MRFLFFVVDHGTLQRGRPSPIACYWSYVYGVGMMKSFDPRKIKKAVRRTSSVRTMDERV
jgi:hypothetical protein